jgi:hypothetical protein
MKQSGFKAENGYNPESNTPLLKKKRMSDKKTMMLPSKPTLSDSRYDTRNHSVKSKHKMLHQVNIKYISILSQKHYT